MQSKPVRHLMPVSNRKQTTLTVINNVRRPEADLQKTRMRRENEADLNTDHSTSIYAVINV